MQSANGTSGPKEEGLAGKQLTHTPQHDGDIGESPLVLAFAKPEFGILQSQDFAALPRIS
jgi:hypothetical protein